MPSEILQFRPEQLQLSDATPLGSGAISHVVQSELTKPKVSIVVKILSKIQLLQQSRVESAMHEKDALVRMGPHPFVARLYGTGQSEDELYFVMEHLPHGDLLQHIRRTAARRVCEYAAAQEGNKEQDAKDKKVVHSPEPSAPPSSKADGSGGGATAKAAGSKKDNEDLKVVPIPPSSRALRCLDFSDVQLITAQLVLGLTRVFECGFVLRDFKPENIAFDRKYRAVLIDFDTVDLEGSSSKPTTNGGVALRDEQKKDEEPGTRRRLTVSEIQDMRRRTSSFCGTAQYVSPEMVGECRWSYSSDLWALGAVVYEMVYGVHMFSGLTPFDVMKKVVKGIDGGSAGGGTSSWVQFPVVDLAGGCDKSFGRVKDFVSQLVHIDPRRRLGVHPTTGEFDVQALKSHALFDGFDWRIVESHVDMFRPHDLAIERQLQQERELKLQQLEPGSPPPPPIPDYDPSPSLLSHYEAVPENDPTYADYVYRATADANPFERYMKHILLGEEEAEDDEGTAAAPIAKDTAEQSAAGADTGAASSSSSDEDEMDDVIDDVGVKSGMGTAHEDFHH